MKPKGLSLEGAPGEPPEERGSAATGGAPSPSAFELFAPLAPAGIVPGIDTMRRALAAAGDPQRALPCVHVAGTNGKGSVTALAESALRASGLRTGMYTSPHLHRFVERVRVDGTPLGETTAAALAEEILAGVASGRLPSLSFFEATTLLGWLAFAREGVDVVALEVGLGGRLDATTVCSPRVTVITRIALDHTDRLGSTLDAIAREKAGILKPGVPCVLGPSMHPEARAAIEDVARAVGAPLLDTAPPTLATAGGEAVVRVPWRGAHVDLRPGLPGPWQAENVATAARALEVLAEGGMPVTADTLASGVAAARWPARMERVGDALLDAAHNPDGAEALARALPDVLGGARVGAMVFGASRDKDFSAMLATLARAVDPSRWFLAAAAMRRAAEPELLAGVLGGTACASPEEALSRARAACAPGEVVLVCGSIFLVAAVRASLLGIEQDPPIAL